MCIEQHSAEFQWTKLAKKTIQIQIIQPFQLWIQTANGKRCDERKEMQNSPTNELSLKAISNWGSSC